MDPQSSMKGNHMDDWRDIETAPKDGEYIILYDPKKYGRKIFIGHWVERECREFGRLVSHTQEWQDAEVFISFSQKGLEPTHWLPHPAFPKE